MSDIYRPRKPVIHEPAALAGIEPEQTQWRNIKHVVITLADWAFGSKDDPKWGLAWISIVNGLTAKDGPAFKLEPLDSAATVERLVQERDMWRDTDLRDASRIDELAAQLAASQAREQQLREALEGYLLQVHEYDGRTSAEFEDEVTALLALPQDSTALRQQNAKLLREMADEDFEGVERQWIRDRADELEAGK